jgi:tRNA pseudouridine32 synthase/23S rRNA pseudouridine746 synthase
VVDDAPEGDFSRPLLLLAQSLAFQDPITGAQRHFVSRRSLGALPTN